MRGQCFNAQWACSLERAWRVSLERFLEALVTHSRCMRSTCIVGVVVRGLSGEHALMRTMVRAPVIGLGVAAIAGRLVEAAG